MERISHIFLILLATWILVIHTQCGEEAYAVGLEKELPGTVDFNFHIKPILSDRCFKCHGPDDNARKANLRLDLPEIALKQKLKSGGRAIVSGKPGRSKIYHRMISQDPDFHMPPPESNLYIEDYEIALIAKWIDQGAKYKKHWAYIPPKKLKIPDVRNGEWPRNELDHFILSRLEQENILPAEEALKSNLLRRLSFDLRGLPPAVNELDEFLADENPDAYENWVDRYLASEHYGEKMAMGWLDMARYADSHGYQDDGMRNTWPWRDWVINAFNDNMPFDQFVQWQLSGDLLPDPTNEQLLATCFNRNHPQTQEGGIVDEEYRVEYVADRTNTFGTVFLGMTLGCARCHDHKYDPVSQEEYYSIFAFFNNVNESGIVPYNGEASPTLLIPSVSASDSLENLSLQIESLEKELLPEKYISDFKRWYESIEPQREIPASLENGLVASFDFEREHHVATWDLDFGRGEPPQKKPGQKPVMTYAFYNRAKNKVDASIYGDLESRPRLIDGVIGNGIQFLGDAGVRFNHDLDFDLHQDFSVSAWIRLLEPGETGPIFNKTNGDFEGYRGWLCKLNADNTISIQFNHVWPDDCIDIQITQPLVPMKWTHLVLSYDGSGKADGIRCYVNGKIPEREVHKDNLKKSLLFGKNRTNWSYLPFMVGMELRKSMENLQMDELKVYDREISNLEVGSLYQLTGDTSLKGIVERKEENEDKWVNHYLKAGNDKSYNDKLNLVTDLREKKKNLLTDQPSIMIMKERNKSRNTYVLDRGMYDSPGKEVQPGLPESLSSILFDKNASRLDLSQWLTGPDNPLTARVIVNRLWMQCFGKGLVSTQEDFGSQGALPSHPDLLDWLSVDLVENEWNIKALVKKIVMSSIYRQSSIANEETQLKDPQNDWYSRFPAHRLNAEEIRDNALAASNLLVREIGGPSVYPYQPEGIWEALATRNETRYLQQHGDNLYRRSLYTVWKRSSPPPALMSFDAPDRYYCVVSRQNTSTPLQSLVLMNDPQYIEASRVLAQNIMKATSDPQEAIELAFKALCSRLPSHAETSLLIRLLEREKADFTDDQQRLTGILEAGEYPLDHTLNLNELAAYTIVASTIMNFDEFIMKR